MKLIIGITGASGVAMGLRLIETLKASVPCEVHLVLTDAARRTWALETDKPIDALLNAADVVYDINDMAASIASGSFRTDGMIVLPCSMKTLAGIVSGYADDLLLRAADVCLKEERRLVLCPRETPLGKVHLRNMYEAAQLGCTIVPPMLTFYNRPGTVEEQVDHIIGKVLMLFGIQPERFRPWE